MTVEARGESEGPIVVEDLYSLSQAETIREVAWGMQGVVVRPVARLEDGRVPEEDQEGLRINMSAQIPKLPRDFWNAVDALFFRAQSPRGRKDLIAEGREKFCEKFQAAVAKEKAIAARRQGNPPGK